MVYKRFFNSGMRNIFLSAFVLTMAACKTPRSIVVNQIDSTRTEIRYEKVYVRDTAYIEIPSQTSERVAKDSVSNLENDFATSQARINADGTLYHDLKTKPREIPVVTNNVIERRDSIIFKEKRVEVPVPVERKLGWWEHTAIRFFPWSLVLLSCVLLYMFRKPIINLARRLI